MSRTDAHAPLWVRLSFEDLPAQAWHALDHSTCDLPAHPSEQDWSQRSFPIASCCFWTYRYVGVNICCCKLCRAGGQRRADRQSVRHFDRQSLHVALGRWAAGDPDAFDAVGRPRRRSG